MALDEDQFAGLAGFRLALRQFMAAAEAISKAAGVTQPQYQALLAIRAWPYEAMIMTNLADQLLMTHHAAVQLVNRLAAAGLATRTPLAADRRKVRLTLTPAGLAIVEALAAQHLEEVLHQAPLLTRSLRHLRRMAPPPTD